MQSRAETCQFFEPRIYRFGKLARLSNARQTGNFDGRREVFEIDMEPVELILGAAWRAEANSLVSKSESLASSQPGA